MLCEKPFFPLTGSRFDFDFFHDFYGTIIAILTKISEIAILTIFFAINGIENFAIAGPNDAQLELRWHRRQVVN